jgi:hypothetical protein
VDSGFILVHMTPTYEYLTVSQVARLLQLSSERIRQLDRSGRLKADQTTALGRLYLPAPVDAYRTQNGMARQGSSDAT